MPTTQERSASPRQDSSLKRQRPAQVTPKARDGNRMVSRHAEAQPEEISFAGAAEDTDLATALAADVLLALAGNNVRPLQASAAEDDIFATTATAHGRASHRTRLQRHPDALRGVPRVLRKQQSSDDVRAILHNAVFLM